MKAAKDYKQINRRIIDSHSCKGTNHGILQGIFTISVETVSDISKRHIHESAKRASSRKGAKTSSTHIELGYIGREYIKFNHLNLNKGKRQIGKDELLLIVSHGHLHNSPKGSLFCGVKPESLARIIYYSKLLPKDYAGQIYLDGCHTGEPDYRNGGKLNDGTSYAERFKKELLEICNIDGTPQFTVKGNLGTAATGILTTNATGNSQFNIYGTEWIYISNENTGIINQNINNILTNPHKYNFGNASGTNKYTYDILKGTNYYSEDSKQEKRVRGRFGKVIY